MPGGSLQVQSLGAGMAIVTFKSKPFSVRDEESLLKALLRQGSDIPFSCGKGSCTVCMQRCTSGAVPAAAQRGLKPELVAKGYFLPCLCFPVGDMTVDTPRPQDFCFRAIIVGKQMCGDDVCRFLLDAESNLSYRAGQYVNLIHPDGSARSYSLASVLGEEPYLELHVQRVAQGRVSPWLLDEVAEGDWLTLSGPFGDNFYREADKHTPLVLIGTGTGLAPLYGILKSALLGGHAADVHLYAGGSDPGDLYLHRDIDRYAQAYPQLHYRPCVVRNAEGFETIAAKSRIAERAFQELDAATLASARFHVAGQPATVQCGVALADKAGIEKARVLSDSFMSPAVPADEAEPPDRRILHREHGPRQFPPDPEMWAALGQGKLLRTILEDFYTQVFDDPRLSPYFHNVTKDRVTAKVYSYLSRAFGGSDGYFGDHPRNAHHWMVIDNDLFDHRERLLTECMAKHGLPDPLIRRWRALEELFRRDIVKPEPWGRIIEGVETPVENMREDVFDIATVCDGCEGEIAAGEKVLCHPRLGKVYGKCCHDTAKRVVS